jgi:membrane-associated phospholipid phosphatase
MARFGSRSTNLIIVGLLLAFCLWTYLMTSWSALQEMDADLQAPALDPRSATAQIAAAFSLLTWPGLVYLSLLGIALWAFQHRLRQLATALVLIVPFAWGGAGLLKISFRRERPGHALDVLTTTGYSYPSGHMVAATAAVIAVGAAFAVTRQSVRAKVLWQLGAAVIVLAVAFDRWVLGAHFVSDIVGGLLYGALVATVALASRCRCRTSSCRSTSGAGPRQRSRTGRPSGAPSSTTRPR